MSPPRTPTIQPGEVIGGKYRVESVLGEGGMGCVLVARHVHFDDRVAIKVLHAHVANNPDAVARFNREGRAARLIRSEHVVQITDVDILPSGSPYLVMEYLEGADLAQMLAQRGPFAVAQAVDYVLQACEALAEAHARGIVHRDLKPANLFVTRRTDGSACVKVLDFGISKISDAGHALTSTSAIIGTPLYMSPEQLEKARSVDARSDLWSIGVILYELVSKALPFHADTLPQILVTIVLEDPTPLHQVVPGCDPRLEEVILKCLRKKREDRFQHVGELAAALASFAPPHSNISLERISRLTGLSPTVRSVPPPALEPVPDPSSSAVTALATSQPFTPPPSTPSPMAASLESVGPPIELASLNSVRAPVAPASPSSPSTMAGTTTQSPSGVPRSSAGRWAVIGSVAVLALCGIGFGLSFALRGKEPEAPATSTKSTEEPNPPANTGTAASDPTLAPTAAPLPRTSSPSAVVSAAPTASLVVPHLPGASTLVAGKPSASVHVPKAWGDDPKLPAATTTAPPKPTGTKSNEDY